MDSIGAEYMGGAGVAKKIALFEFAHPDNATANRLRRQDAIKRKNSNQSSSASSISSSTISSSTSESEILIDDFGTTSSCSSETSECYEGSLATTTSGPTSTSTSGIYQTSSDDYEIVSTKMKDSLSIGTKSSFEKIPEKVTKQKLVSTKKKSLQKDCHRSLPYPFIPGHLQLVEFTDIQLDSQSSEEDGANVSPALSGERSDEPFYEELDNYNNNQNQIEFSNNAVEHDGGDAEEDKRTSLSTEITASFGAERDEEQLDSGGKSENSAPNDLIYAEPSYGAHGKIDNASTSSYSSYNHQSRQNAVDAVNNAVQGMTVLQNQESSNNYCSKSRFSLNAEDSWYDIAFPSSKLPPIPSSASTVNKFSSIAKSAGKKLSKKLSYLRRLSRTSFDGSSFGGSSSEFYSTLSINQSQSLDYSANSANQLRRNSCHSVTSSLANDKEALATKRSCIVISRPSIPPPEPPRNVPPTKVPVPNLENIPVSKISIPPIAPNEAGIYSNTEEVVLPRDTYDDEDMDDDDSDFYDSDSELIRNFVAAVQPIYSMEEEPLYQYYTYGISLQPEDNNYQPVIPKNLGLTLDMLVPRTGQRTLWCELPEVISSGILSILSEQQKKLQEAIFEILTSEVSYLKSLDVLVMLFFENDALVQVLTPEDRFTLFGNITYVKDCAQSFLSELLTKWEESWYIQDVGQVINENANNKFQVYKEYCRNKPYQDKILQKLRSTNDEFVSIIKTIEEDSRCQLLRMDSFLMLPMQRITRLPLLVNAIIQRIQSPKEKLHCEEALKSLTNLVLACNDAAKESQDSEETATVFEKLEFSKTIKSIPSPGQFLLKGDFMKNPFDSGRGQRINWTFQKNKKTFYWLILFTNQLFITKKKSSGKFEVIDMMSPLDSNVKPLPNLEGISKDFQHFFMLHFDRNETVYFLAARTQSEVERWKQNLEQLKEKKDLKVQAVFTYEAKLKDELSFVVGDTILVSQTQPDGWYYGRKINTEDSGWFPGNYCVESEKHNAIGCH